MIRRALEFLVQVKNDLKKVDVVEAMRDSDRVNAFTSDEDGGMFEDDEDDGGPLTWAEQKNIRVELRRFQLWHALRMKVPKGFEEGV